MSAADPLQQPSYFFKFSNYFRMEVPQHIQELYVESKEEEAVQELKKIGQNLECCDLEIDEEEDHAPFS